MTERQNIAGFTSTNFADSHQIGATSNFNHHLFRLLDNRYGWPSPVRQTAACIIRDSAMIRLHCLNWTQTDSRMAELLMDCAIVRLGALWVSDDQH